MIRHNESRNKGTPRGGRVRVIVCACLLTLGTGCDSQPAQQAASTDRFVPTPAAAEYAIRKVLDSWRAGQPVGMVPNTSPAIHVTDSFRRPDERLVDYHILGETPSEHPRCLVVDLRFEPERIERTRFTVVGIDPLWVMRAEDAELLQHWEHHMQADAPAEPPAAQLPPEETTEGAAEAPPPAAKPDA